MRRDPRVYLLDALTAGELIRSFLAARSLEDYEKDAMLRSAVERQFEVVGEALRQLTEVAPEMAARIPACRRVVAFRNQLAHGYFAIRDDVVWAIATNDLPRLLEELRAVVGHSESE
jgi:uncharacterized protein with HEPN domain